MKWTKKGILLRTEDLGINWASSHVQLPTPYRVNNDVLRVYVSLRDKECKSRPIYIDVNANDYSIMEIHREPLLELGKAGTFDDCGITFSSCIDFQGKIYMYYIGWNRDYVLPYVTSIGLAVSEDGGLTFRKMSEGPVMDRDFNCPYFNATPYVLKENEYLRMYYLYATEWQYNSQDGYVPAYLIKSAVSKDGIHWEREPGECIGYKNAQEAIARPCVYKAGDKYYMWYSYRSTTDFRRNRENAYMIGFAESDNGKEWTRKDESVGIAKSEKGWDSEMMCYTSVIENRGDLVMFYNGNGNGKYAFGYATCGMDSFPV